MSHTVTIDSVEITNIRALKSAVNELRDKGFECNLLENTIPNIPPIRGSKPGAADYVLRSPRSVYDVAFYASKNSKGSTVYEMRTDEMMMRNSLYSTPSSAVGKVTQLYSVHAVTQQAARQGYRVSRNEQKDGSITLSLVGR